MYRFRKAGSVVEHQVHFTHDGLHYVFNPRVLQVMDRWWEGDDRHDRGWAPPVPDGVDDDLISVGACALRVTQGEERVLSPEVYDVVKQQSPAVHHAVVVDRVPLEWALAYGGAQL